MILFRKIRLFIIRRMPRRRHLHGSILHRAIGEKLFDARIWKFSRKSVAGGLAIGLFIAMTPTIGFQMFIAGIFAYMLRVNIPFALIACWVTNPLTAPVIYPLQYKLGCWVIAKTWHDGLAEKATLFQNFFQYAKPLGIGSLIVGLICAIAAYILVFTAWDLFSKKSSKKKDSKNDNSTTGDELT